MYIILDLDLFQNRISLDHGVGRSRRLCTKVLFIPFMNRLNITESILLSLYLSVKTIPVLGIYDLNMIKWLLGIFVYLFPLNGKACILTIFFEIMTRTIKVSANKDTLWHFRRHNNGHLSWYNWWGCYHCTLDRWIKTTAGLIGNEQIDGATSCDFKYKTSFAYKSFECHLYFLWTPNQIITKTRLYNFDPLKPHLDIVKLGLTGVYIIFLISAQ